MDEDQVRQSSDAPGNTVADTTRHPGAARTPRAQGPEAAYDYSDGIGREAGLHRTTRARAVDQRAARAAPVAGDRVPTKSAPNMDRQERERTARDLYDRIIQDIYAGTLELETLALDLPDRALAAQLERLSRHFTTVIADLQAYGGGARSRLWSAGGDNASCGAPPSGRVTTALHSGTNGSSNSPLSAAMLRAGAGAPVATRRGVWGQVSDTAPPDGPV